MDRLAALLEELPLPELARLLRRCALSALAIGVAVLAISVALSHLLVGVGACAGLALGLANVRLVARSAARLSERKGAHVKRVLASHTLARLAVTTAIVIGLMFLSSQLGLASAGGLAVFYLLLVVTLLTTLLRGMQAST